LMVPVRPPYGDGLEDRPYRSKSGVQDGIWVDGSVGGKLP